MKIKLENGGWFDFSKSKEIKTTQTPNCFRWRVLLLTSQGRLVLGEISCVDGEKDTWRQMEAVNEFLPFMGNWTDEEVESLPTGLREEFMAEER